jgi:DNA-binding MarR family transcriptional regulator
MKVAMANKQESIRELVDRLRQAKHWFHDATRDLHPQHSRTAVSALVLLERHGPSRVSELAEEARVDLSVISRQLQSLEANGLAERRPDPEDGRAHLVRMTPLGTEALAVARTALDDRVADQLAHWEPEEVRALAESLRRLMHDLQH